MTEAPTTRRVDLVLDPNLAATVLGLVAGTLTADRIVYDDGTGRIAAEGDLVLRDPGGATNWGISLRWSDGHDTGIFAWTHLRTWWDDNTDSIP